MSISTQSLNELLENGFTLVRGAVAPQLVDNAVQTINHRLGQGFSTDELVKFSAQTFFPELRDQPVLTDLFNASGVHETLETLLGEGNVPRAGAGQLALRFPREVGTLPQDPRPHIDGVYTPTNGVPQGTLGSFTALVGVFLTDIARDFAGNLAVWPRSHRKMEAFFRKNGVEELMKGGKIPDLDYGPPQQIQAQAGDVVIAHYQLLHGVTMNLAPFPRYAVFFRVTHPMHSQNRRECLTNLWLEWPGAQE
ncbi:MAG: phytanoyl-CoA dioxygenase family protein [Armatimonadetes bacterium]|nr:phytanoyl-CoA dioxygenase family protein [Armatimonadota bacterium]